MSRFVLTPRVQADLEDIWSYSAQRWNVEQAEAYIRVVQRGVNLVADDPRRGRCRDDVRPGYRSYGVGSHVLYYREGRGEISIVRILHARMDPTRHM
jgi:toxin ParE1/3/4